MDEKKQTTTTTATKTTTVPLLSLLLPLLCFLPQISSAVPPTRTMEEDVRGNSCSHHRHRRHHGGQLLVFGDSYVDTGNLPRILSPSWSDPYGMTFPEKPAGRFSDGRVLTDYLATFMGIKSPIPYKYRRYGRKLLPFGMNFAAGGSGVFDDTSFLSDNLTVQINTFKEQVALGVLSHLQSSTALVAISGNDYFYYRQNGGSMQGLKKFIPKVIHQLKQDLRSLAEVGIPKVAVTNLHPIGCVPIFTANSSYRECNRTINLLVAYHNQLLRTAIDELNQDTGNASSVFVILDLFHGFMSVLNQQGRKRNKFRSMLKPCCQALGSDNRCGSVDIDGVKMYTVCASPHTAFYWDTVHPTQAGWSAVFSSLRTSLTTLLPPAV